MLYTPFKNLIIVAFSPTGTLLITILKAERELILLHL
jgi:hypothetical protein